MPIVPTPVRLRLLVLLAAALAGPATPASAADAPPELGEVAWIRDHDRAFARAADEKRPVLLLFQSVPGSRRAKRLGEGPLRMPLVVEAIETLFVPLAIFNNASDESHLLARYDEPAWGDPVVRFFSQEGRELIARKDRALTSLGLVSRMRRALRAAKVDAPVWFSLLEQDLVGSRLEHTTIAMPCYKDGERRIGGLDGVIRTEAAWIGKHEVVDVVFDPKRVTFEQLLEHAKDISCLHVYVDDEAQAGFARTIIGERVSVKGEEARPAKGDDRKFFLGRSELRLLPLTPAQATKVNAALGLSQDPTPYLSPRQRALLDRVRGALKENPKALDGLEPPEELDALPAYTARLRERLP